ncbi:MAG: LacI family DNA-binding transcriptional regulator, partial [Spirochaetia bacterium]|nr:LacI family DNA-binding transcriptional regulator [Spirochaetia bacterium]
KPVVHVPEKFPEVRINRALIKEYGENKKTREFIRSYVNRVREIIKALEERNKTIENVVKKILARQEDFMRYEEAGLKPLTLKEIAREVGVAESTVSRIVSKKYIQMPSGVYPLKHFFTSGMDTSSGERVSDESVKAKIRDMIEAEDKTRPLTDTVIERKLNESGVKISRRTVTKYREQLGLGPVNLRRK